MDCRLAVVTPENTVALYEANTGDAWLPRRDHGPGLWPTPRPGASEWTVSVVGSKGSLEHRAEDSSRVEVPGSQTEPPLLIGARLPHYAAWTGDGGSLCYVVPDGRSLSLRVWRPGDQGVRTLLSRAPLFPQWLANGPWLVCHHGATLTAFDTSGGEQRVLSTGASGFRTPSVADDGRTVAWAEVRDSGVAILCGEVETRELRTMTRFGAGVALKFRPGTRALTAAVATAPESGVFGELVEIQDGSVGPRRIVKGPLVAFWWAPGGERVATLHPMYSGDGRFQVRLHDARGRFLRATEGVIPSSDTATMVGFFDQYSDSHPCWSRDGRWFGLCGRLVKEGPHPSFSGGGSDRALAWDTLSGRNFEDIGDGQLLVFAR